MSQPRPHPHDAGLGLAEKILVHLPVAVSVLDPQLRFLVVNQRAAQINGVAAEAHAGRYLSEVLPDLPQWFLDELRQVVSTGVPRFDLDVDAAMPGRTGMHRFRGNYFPLYDGAGSIAFGVAAIFDEVSQTAVPVRVEQLAAQRASWLPLLDTLVDNAPFGIAVLDPALRVTRMNAVLAQWMDVAADQMPGRLLHEIRPDLAAALKARGGDPVQGSVTGIETAEGHRVWVNSFLTVPVPHGQDPSIALLVTEITAQRETEAAARRLQRFTAELAQAVTVADVAEAVCDAGARAAGAKATGVALLDETGQALRFAATAMTAREPWQRWAAVPIDADHPVTAAMTAGGSAFYPDPAALLNRYPALLEAQQVTGDQAWAVVPVSGRGTTAGVLTFAFGSEQQFGDDQRASVQAIAGLAGQALARAQLYEREHQASQRLQRSLLPARLPQVPGAEIAAVYSSGDSGQVGGDFYDAFTVDDDPADLALVIGDVTGKGIAAAAVTGMARNTLRITATLGEPAEALRRLNVRLRVDPDVDRLVTAVCGRLRISASGATLDIASAGHPPVLVRRSDGSIETITVAGTVLGAFRQPNIGQRRVSLSPGDSVVFYTDGVLEARGSDGFFGQQRLFDAVASARPVTAAGLAESVKAEVAAYHHGPVSDDLAVLVVRLLPDPSPL